MTEVYFKRLCQILYASAQILSNFSRNEALFLYAWIFFFFLKINSAFCLCTAATGCFFPVANARFAPNRAERSVCHLPGWEKHTLGASLKATVTLV